MAVMTNKNEMKCAVNYLKELKSHASGYAVKWLDIAIEAVERDIKEFDLINNKEINTDGERDSN